MSGISGFDISRVKQDSSEEDLEKIVNCCMDAFEGGSTYDINKLPREITRLRHLQHVIPGIASGEVWIAESNDGDEVLSVAVWSLPGKLLADEPSYKEYGDKFKARGPESQVKSNEAREKVIKERERLYPGLWRDSLHLHLLATSPKARRKGIASAILKPVMDRTRAEGKGMKMTLSTQTEDARVFYERNGFEVLWEGRIEKESGGTEPYYVMLAQ